MTAPFRIGVMQLTMEPLDEMLASARVMDEAGMDTVWLAEAYPWWRKHGMEARSSTVVSALMARETTRLTIGWGIISPFTRHPVQVAMDARVVQEAAGPGRFLLGFGTSKIFLNNIRSQTKKTLGPMRDAVAIVKGVLGGGAFAYEGETWSADVPALQDAAHTPRDVPPVYVAATAPKMQALAGEIADGCLTPSITTPAFVRYTRENVDADIDIGCTVVASIDATDRDRGRDGAREIAGMYLANKVQNIAGLRGCAPRPRRDRAGRDPPCRRRDGSGWPARCEGEGHRRSARQVQADRGHAGRVHRGNRGVPRRRLHARDARALGRGPPRADPPVRRGGAATLPLVSDKDLDAFTAFEVAGWERQAATYEASVGRVTSRVIDPLLDAAGVVAGSRVLDVATGPGEIAARAAARGAKATGCDVAEAMLERARAKHPGIDFRQANAEELPFEDGRFDAAVAGFLLLHLARPERVAAELARVLAVGGRVAATVWDAPERNRYLGVMFDAIGESGATPPPDLPAGPPFFRFADESLFAQLLEGAGFADVTVAAVAFEERLASSGELWEAIMAGGVRTPPMVLGQPEPVQREIRARFDELLEKHRVDGGYDVPVSVKLASGTKAG